MQAQPVSSGPSDFNWLTAIGAGLQSAGAAHFGNYGVGQGYMQMKQQADLRKQMFAQQQAQMEEQKNQHHMQMVEKLIQTGNVDALNAYGKQYAPAGLIGSAMAQKDLAEVPSLMKGGYLEQEFVQSIFDQDPSKRPTPGQIKAHVDFAKEQFKEDYKAQVKGKFLDKALAKPVEQRTPGEQRLVDEHQTEMDLKKAQSFEHEAKGIKALEGGDEKDHSILGRLGESMFGKPWNQLDQAEKEIAYQQYRKDNIAEAGAKSTASQQAQVAVPDKLGSEERKAVMNDIQAMNHINTLKSVFKPELIGRIRGTVGGIKEWAGLIGTDESTLRSEIATMKNMVIQARSGLATSAQEAARIDKEVPDATNSPTIFMARLKLTERNLRKLANDRRNLYKQTGLDVSGLTPIAPEADEKADPESRFNQILKENGGNEDAAYKQMKKEGY